MLVSRRVIKIFPLLLILGLFNLQGSYVFGKVKIEYLSHTTDINELKLYRELGKMFTSKNPDIEVEVTSVPERFYEQLQIRIASGMSPDATFLANWHIPPFVERGALTCLDPFVEKERYNLAKFFPNTVEACKVGGKLYGLPRHPSPMVLYYNKDLFDKAGISYPNDNWTWEKDFLEAAKKLTKTDDKGKYIQWGAYISRDISHVLLPIIYCLGGRILDEDMKKCVIDTPQSITAIQWLGDLWVKHKVAITPDLAAGLAGDPFVLGKVAMVPQIYPFIITQAQFIKDFKWDVVILPKGKGGRWNRAAVGVHAIPAGAKHPEEAWKWLKFLATEEAQLKIAESGLVMPSLRVLASSPKFLQPAKGPQINRKAFVDGMTKSKLVKEIFHPKWSEMETQVIAPEFDLVFLGKKSAEEACKKIAIECNRILGVK